MSSLPSQCAHCPQCLVSPVSSLSLVISWPHNVLAVLFSLPSVLSPLSPLSSMSQCPHSPLCLCCSHTVRTVHSLHYPQNPHCPGSCLHRVLTVWKVSSLSPQCPYSPCFSLPYSVSLPFGFLCFELCENQRLRAYLLTLFVWRLFGEYEDEMCPLEPPPRVSSACWGRGFSGGGYRRVRLGEVFISHWS